MSESIHTSRSELRSLFSKAMSQMYRTEVPAYATLIKLVEDVNTAHLLSDDELRTRLKVTGQLHRISEERHGAIRLGSAQELSMIGRIFAVMGMYPVGYYDLSVAGIPVHATAFRPVERDALNRNPFRVFTSLLRLDLIKDKSLRQQANSILSKRNIFTPKAISLVEKAELSAGLEQSDHCEFVNEVLESFRWHTDALVSDAVYRQLHNEHRLIADVVSFRGPHINHLTPRTLDIDAVQSLMPEYGIKPKAVIEGPPRRNCPILLRQTSFKALEERVNFPDLGGKLVPGHHTARFGEIEQRGVALTKKGKELYDQILSVVRSKITPAIDGSNSIEYERILEAEFEQFPDSWRVLHDQKLACFNYYLTDAGHNAAIDKINFPDNLKLAVEQGLISYDPIVYEDFLPVSAAGIFQSNLGDSESESIQQTSSQDNFEAALGRPVLNAFKYYNNIQTQSLERCLLKLSLPIREKSVSG